MALQDLLDLLTQELQFIALDAATWIVNGLGTRTCISAFFISGGLDSSRWDIVPAIKKINPPITRVKNPVLI